MPIATPQGTLDFKSVDKVTFVGASSNTVIDTTTGSLGVGVGVGGPTSNLHVVGHTRLEGDINMLHTANTASIKLNSNVVTEFPRSKKLIKYPRVAMTANSSGGYVVDQTNTASHGNADAYAYRLFDNTSEAYQSGSAYSGGNPTASAPTTTASDGSTHHGVAITLDLVTKIRLDHVVITSHSNYGRTPVDGTFLGSDNSSVWDVIQTFSGLSTSADNQKHTIYVTNPSQKLAYRYIRFVITKTHTLPVFNGGSLLEFRETEYYGVPEYDPDAHGTDVTVKSYPNVPNTDWLEVYYDAKNYTSGVVQDLSTNSFNGTLTNGASYNNSDGIDKFVFDGSNDYISGTIPSTFTGNQMYTFSSWIKPDSHPSGFIGVFGIGTNSTDDSIGLFLDGGNIIHLTYGNNLTTTAYATIGEWVHITGTYDGTGRTVFVNGKLVGTDSYSSLTLAGTTFKLGSNLTGTQAFDGSIANFRLFNRALTSDEIYQLYAYQKKDFGHGDVSMTLKAGRLGIGTSEPRAMLDVRGDIHGGCPVLFDCVASSTTAVGSYINWNLVKLNKGSGLNGTTFTAPVEGHYFFHVHVMGVWTPSSTDVRFIMEWHKNGVHYGVNSELDAQMYDGRDDVDGDSAHLKLSGSIIPYLEIGDTIKIILPSNGNMGVHGRYNRFTGHYIG